VRQLRLDAAKKRSKAALLLRTPVDVNAETNTYSRSASVPVKTQPQVARTTLIGLFVGLVLGMILAFIQDVLDTRIRSAEDVGRRLRVPLLARIPAVPRRFGRQPAMLAEPTPALVPTSEAYRIAKLNLSGLLERRNARTLMFTSAAEDEGTSQTIANMAIVLARAGRHVIIVDANMRSPMQAEFFGLDDRAGLSEVLSGRAKLADTLTAVEVSRVHDVDAGSNGHAHTEGILEVLPAGSPTADPAELLDTRTAADLLLALRQRADVVLVDAPAILPVTDAMVLASKVDAVVVVSRARRASRPNIVAMRRALDNCPAPAIGFVFTGDASGRRNDYGGSYVARTVGGSGEEERDPREVGVL
jgi:capsular exopolysaccharide synthesis family protein